MPNYLIEIIIIAGILLALAGFLIMIALGKIDNTQGGSSGVDIVGQTILHNMADKNKQEAMIQIIEKKTAGGQEKEKSGQDKDHP